MQLISPHPSGARCRYSVPYCDKVKKAGPTRIVFDYAGKVAHYGSHVMEVANQELGPAMRKTLANADDVINLGFPQIIVRIAVSILNSSRMH
jgi:hypothetical protein